MAGEIIKKKKDKRTHFLLIIRFCILHLNYFFQHLKALTHPKTPINLNGKNLGKKMEYIFKYHQKIVVKHALNHPTTNNKKKVFKK